MRTEFRRLRLLSAVFVGVATVAAGYAQAQTMPIMAPSAASTPAGQLSSLQAQIPVLKAQAEIAKLKAEIADAGKSKSGTPGMPGAPGVPGQGFMPGMPGYAGMPPAAVSATPAPATDAASWRITEINGFNGQYTAVLVDGAGHAHDIAPGIVLPGDWRVAEIAPRTVVLTKGEARRVLGF